MDFGKLHEKSVKIKKKDEKLSKTFSCAPENAGCILLAVVILTNANEIYQGIRVCLSFPIFAEISRSFPKCKPTSHEVFLSPLDPINVP